MIDFSKVEPEIKGLLGVAALAPVGFLLMALFFYLGAFERINIGILIFIIGVAVFLGALVVSKKASMKAARNMAIGGLVLLLVEGVCAALMIGSVFHF